MRTSRRAWCAVVMAGGLLMFGGCHEPRVRLEPTFLPKSQAIHLVNRNNAGIQARLYGRGHWSGTLARADGARENRTGTFKIHYARPDRLCFQTKGLGGNYFEAGSNPEVIWFWLQYDRDELTLASRDDVAGLTLGRLPLQPSYLIDALGLQLIEPEPSGSNAPIYRVADDYHELIYNTQLEGEHVVITREYWLDRYEPFLIRRVLYRQTDGRVLMEARLDDHATVSEGGPFVARSIDIRWPLHDSALKLRFDAMKEYDDVDNVWFMRPDERQSVNPLHRPPREVQWLDEAISDNSDALP